MHLTDKSNFTEINLVKKENDMPASTLFSPMCPDTLTDDHLARFKEDGFLAFEGLLTTQEVEIARAEISRLVRRNLDASDAVLSQRILSLPSERFGVQFESGITENDLAVTDVELKVRKLMHYCEVSSFFAELADSHPKLRGILQAILGPDSIMFQDMALIKPPYIGTIKPWHQDNAYFSVAPLDLIVGAWIALDPATVENGCMHVIPGGHRHGALKHIHDRDCEIVPDRIDESRQFPVELNPGGVLFFYGMLPHQTPPNQSPDRRRALQLHYHAAECVKLADDEYDQLYAENGEPASCSAARRQGI